MPVVLFALALAVLAGLAPLPAAAQAERGARAVGRDALAADETVLAAPEPQRAFLQDGPAWLLPEARRAELAALEEAQRQAAIEELLARDPVPGTPENELQEGIRRRRALVAEEIGTFNDVRAQLLFLHGVPAQRSVIDCASVFRPLEVWSYLAPAAKEEASLRQEQRAAERAAARDEEERLEEIDRGDLPPAGGAGTDPAAAAGGEAPAVRGARYLVLYQPLPGEPFRLWEPLDAKRALYTPDIEYLLEQFEELRGRIRGRRPDLQLCKQTRLVEAATGVRGLTDYRSGRPRKEDYRAWLQPPEDLAEWARAAAVTPLPDAPPPLAVDSVEVFFPSRDGQRIRTLFAVRVPSEELASAPAEVSGDPQLRLLVDGVLEQGGRVFDDFRVRFRPPPPEGGGPLALLFERELRPGLQYLVRMRVEDEISGAQRRHVLAFRVPLDARPDEVPAAVASQVARGEEVGERSFRGEDNLVLLPPPADTVLNLWRATALVSGERIEEVAFLVDGERQLSTRRRPFTAEVRLAALPVEQVVRAEGLDADGKVVAVDEVVVNRPRASFDVRIVEPGEGTDVSGTVRAVADVSVPEERRLEKVEFRLDDELVATLTEPPIEADVEIPAGGEVTYLSVTAQLADGTRAEAVRFLNAEAGFAEQVEVQLVELYVAAQRDGRLVRELSADDFVVTEEGVEQRVTKFELMDALPLTLGLVLDTSGSMSENLSQAQRAASQFLERVIEPGDRSFAVSFSGDVVLLMPPTDDVEVVSQALQGLRADGWTALHDAVITGLSYFREIEGQQALVVLSDGADTASSFDFDEALEYARRSEAAIYPIGLNIPVSAFGVRNKLSRLATETGGRVFFISQASDLDGVYEEIEEELRSRYLLAYTPTPAPEPGSGFRRIEVEAKARGVETRTVRGYYP